MGIFGNKEEKGFHCDPPASDGSVRCERVVWDKNGEVLGDGQSMQITADPSDNCRPRATGNMVIKDSEVGKFDEIAGRVSAGCKREQKGKE
jgi:hypothetical protein